MVAKFKRYKFISIRNYNTRELYYIAFTSIIFLVLDIVRNIFPIEYQLIVNSPSNKCYLINVEFIESIIEYNIGLILHMFSELRWRYLNEGIFKRGYGVK